MKHSGKLHRALELEADIWRSLWRWGRRRPDVPPGATAFGYAAETKVAVWAFIALSAIEIPIFHLIIPWDVVRWTLLVLSLWGFGWMLGFMASLEVHPHLVDRREVRVRHWSTVDVSVPLSAVASASARRRGLPTSKGVQLERSGERTSVSFAVASQANVHLRLQAPTELQLTSGPVSVDDVYLFADDPSAMVSRLREVLAGASTS